MKINRTTDEEHVICEICKEQKRKIEAKHLKKHNLTYKQYIEMFPNAKTITSAVAKSTAVTKENLIKKYGSEEGMIRWDQYRKKQAHSNTFEYKRKKYNWSEKQFKKFNKSRAVTKDNLIKRHGEEVGMEIWNNYVKKQEYAGNKLEYFVEKYGAEDGRIKFNELNKKKTNNLENFVRKYGEVDGLEKYKKFVNGISKRAYFSKISQSLFREIYEDGNPKVYFASNDNGEFCVYDENIKKVRLYDYVDSSRNKCIEFNGDVFHANPEIYLENDHPNFRNTKLTSLDIWNEDFKKNELIKSKGYDLMIVWERDFVKNPKQIIEQCLVFLYGTNKLPNS